MAGTGDILQNIQEAAASLLFNLKHKYRTSAKAVEFIVKEFNILTNLFLDYVKDVLTKRCAMQNGYLTLETIFAELDSLRGQTLFEGVQSQSYMDSYLAHQSTPGEPFGLIQATFSWKVVYRRGIPHKVPEDFALFPPFLAQLEQLLNCKDVLDCVDNPKPSEDGVFRSVTDGYFYRYHYLVQRHGNKVLSIIIYVDDVEFADPCKTKTRKHKLRLFYWTLGNIYPELRSSLKAINLLAIARYEVAKKWGNEKILKYFMKDLQSLSEGVKMFVNGKERTVYGLLQFVAADIPAAANLGGFKESHFALRPCRVCMITNFALCDHFEEDEGCLRKLLEHNKYLHEIESKPLGKGTVTLQTIALDSPDTNEDEEIDEEFDDVFQGAESLKTYTDHLDPSINYGINRRSVLAEAPGFDVTKCFPYDIMHILFEGVVELVCRLVLKEMTSPSPKPPEDLEPPKKRRKRANPQAKAKISLKYVNKIIQESCDFGHLNVSKPSPIEKPHLKKRLKQSASQMIVLIHILPVIAFGNISTEKMELIGQIIKIISLTMQFETSKENAATLQKSVEEFGENFKKCYPEYKSLKLHSLKHFKMQILLHGPLRQQACFRYEAMHREFTRLVDVVNNMKNIEFSLATRHLSGRNSDIMNGRLDGTFLYQGHTITKGQLNKVEILPEKDLLLMSLPEVDELTEAARVKMFKIHGRTWQEDVIIHHFT